MPDEIFSLVSEEKLKDVLSCLGEYTGIPIELTDRNGNVLFSFGEKCSYCRKIKQELGLCEQCGKIHSDAGRHAYKLGEAYIFCCHAQLNNIAFSVVHAKEHIGTITAGPFLIDAPDSTIINEVNERYPLSPSLALELYDCLGEIKTENSHRVSVLKKLIENTVLPVIPLERITFLQSQERTYQQSKLNETIQIYKEQDMPADRKLFYEKEEDLIFLVKNGDSDNAKKRLNDIIAYITYFDGSFDEVKMRSFEIKVLLERTALENGVLASKIYDLSSRFSSMLSETKTIDDITYTLQYVTESLCDLMFSGKDGGNPKIRKAMSYIAQNYNLPLTLESVSNTAGLSPTYFSSLFSSAVGMNFSDYLCKVRIDASKRLLLSTDYSLSDIAVATGFSDQSYFNKVFKRKIGLSPGQFRCGAVRK